MPVNPQSTQRVMQKEFDHPLWREELTDGGDFIRRKFSPIFAR
jgi:hypothetical protein